MGTFTDVLRSFVEKALFSQSISSASPQKMAEGGNKTLSVDINPADFDRILEAEINKSIATSPAFKPTKEKVDQFSRGNVQKIQSLSTKAFGNIQSIATAPMQYMNGLLTKTLVKATAGVGIALVLLAFINFALDEAMKPGRALDRRFKRLAGDEIMSFWTLQEQEKLRSGFKEIRITTMPGLRGGASQVNGNLFQHQAVTGTLRNSVTDYTRTEEPQASSYTHPFSRIDEDGNPYLERRSFRR